MLIANYYGKIVCVFFYYYKGPWIIGGNFNEIFHSTDKFGSRSVNNSRSNQFADSIDYCNLFDLGYKGSKLIWTNKRRYDYHILEWLDRLFANYEWLSLFHESTVCHLPRTHSDHTPLLLTCQTPHSNKSNIFRFETIWTSHPDFIHILRDGWHPSPSFLEAIEHFQHNIQYWNKTSLGNISHRKNPYLLD